MIPGLLLALREGLEAALILGILFGTLAKLERLEQRRYIWLGSLAALVASVITGLILALMGARLEGVGETVFEGITMLTAAIILTWAIFWMRSQAQTRSASIISEVKHAIDRGSGIGLLGLAFFTVVREGVELSLFLIAVGLSAGNAPTLLGAAVGLLIAVSLGVALYSRIIRLDLRLFFLYSSILLILFAAGLVAHSIHEFNEIGWIPGLIEPVWNTGAVIADDSFIGQFLKTLLGYNADPSLTEIIGYSLYLIVVSIAVLRRAPVSVQDAADRIPSQS